MDKCPEKLTHGSHEIAAKVRASFKSKLWEELSRTCFSCGTCNLVCPTCYCFDVADDLNLDAVSGNRTRTWDGCMLPHFALVAGGHNFRPAPASRSASSTKAAATCRPGRSAGRTAKFFLSLPKFPTIKSTVKNVTQTVNVADS